MKNTEKKTVLITGINGFLGSHLAKRLSNDYYIIGLEYSIDDLYRLDGFSFKVYSSQSENWVNIFKENEIDIIIHTATFYGRNNEDITQIAQTNLFLPFQLLELAIKNNITMFINTDTVLERFVSPYALTKRQFQEWLMLRQNEIKVINMQLEHFYGPGCSNSNFISIMIQRLKNNESSIDLTAGEQKRDFIYFEDVIDAYELIIKKVAEFESNYNNFEVGSGKLISIRELLVLLKKLTKSTTKLNFGVLPYRTNELMKSQTEISKLLELGWSPKTKIERGLINTINK